MIFSSTSTNSSEMHVYIGISEGGRGFFSSTHLPPIFHFLQKVMS